MGGQKYGGQQKTLGTTSIESLNVVQSLDVQEIVKLTQAQYDALPIKNEKTLYLIVNA